MVQNGQGFSGVARQNQRYKIPVFRATYLSCCFPFLVCLESLQAVCVCVCVSVVCVCDCTRVHVCRGVGNMCVCVLGCLCVWKCVCSCRCTCVCKSVYTYVVVETRGQPQASFSGTIQLLGGCLIDWLASCFVGSLVGCWLAGWLFRWLVSWWLVSWCVGWLIGWLETGFLTGPEFHEVGWVRWLVSPETQATSASSELGFHYTLLLLTSIHEFWGFWSLCLHNKPFTKLPSHLIIFYKSYLECYFNIQIYVYLWTAYNLGIVKYTILNKYLYKINKYMLLL